jgi:hypothetical protein
MIRLYALFLLVFMTSTAFARLGETPDQLQARFGPPSLYKPNAQVNSQGHVYVFGQILNFSSQGWSISCTIVNGVCAQINYSKTGDFTNEQLATILTNEAQGHKWAAVTSYKTLVDSFLMPQFHVMEWKRDDGAYASRTGNSITLTTPDYDKAVAAAKQLGTSAAQQMPSNL